MMKKKYLIYSILIAFYSCSTNNELPSGILNQEQMVNLLVDVEIAQAKMKFEVASEGKKPNYVEAYNNLYKKHNLTKDQFLNNINYYCSDPMEMRKVYDKVIIRLSEQQAALIKKNMNE